MKRNILITALLAIVVDAFYFDVTLRIFPIANTKMMLAVIGLFAFVYHSIQNQKTHISRRVLISAILAITFSVWCYFSIVANGSYRDTFVDYYTSFATWLGGAYGVYAILKARYEKVNLSVLTYFLAIICVSQCIIALLIDNIPAVRNLVNAVFLQATDFYERGNRLYGIGCALDPAGVRFSVALVLIAHQLSIDDVVRRDAKKSTFYILSFFFVTIIGSMISRTTIVGTGLGLAFILFSNIRMRRGGIISKIQVNSSLLLLFLLTGTVAISAILYNSSSTFHEDLRFGFEGFFNWIETGEFRTGSTDHLQTMWVWPTSQRGWIIGEGRVGVFQTNSDIGYCNYIIYCGLIGLAIFSTYFMYNHLSLIGKYKDFTLTALLLVAITFIVWAKVMTDIFFIDALLFCIDGDEESSEVESVPET
ncbi:MAG: hypothetical protein IJ653_07920 [Bacteroidales bacterium]|nr:hypothetical protein [Bacteroidales bacterium]